MTLSSSAASAQVRPAPDPALRRARISVSVVFAVHGAVLGTFAPRIPWIADRLDASPGQLGLALIAPALGAMLTMPLSARLIHRFPGRTSMRVLLVFWCLALILPALAPTVPVLALSLFVFGAAAGMSDVAMNAQGVVVEQRYGRSIMSGLHGLWSAGTLAASTIGAVAAARELDARVHFGLVAVLLAGLGWFACAGLPSQRLPGGEAPSFARPSRRVLLIGLVGFCAVFAEVACADWSALFVRDVTGATPGIAAIAYSAFALAMTGGRLVGDAVIRRLGPVRATRTGGAAATAGCVLVLIADQPAVAIPGFGLIGLGVAVVVPLAFAAAGAMGPNPGQAIAGVATIAYGSGLAAPGIIGGIAQATSLTVSFAVVTALCALLIPAAPLLRNPAR